MLNTRNKRTYFFRMRLFFFKMTEKIFLVLIFVLLLQEAFNKFIIKFF